MLDVGTEAGEVAFVCGELFSKKREVVLLEGGGGESGFGVQEATELGNDIFALVATRVSA